MPAAVVPILFPCTRFPVAPGLRNSTPRELECPEMTFPAPAPVPPMVLPPAPTTSTPVEPTGLSPLVPAAFVPMQLPWTVFPVASAPEIKT